MLQVSIIEVGRVALVGIAGVVVGVVMTIVVVAVVGEDVVARGGVKEVGVVTAGGGGGEPATPVER